MKDLLAKAGHFCENHVEKLVLLLAGLIAAWLFFTRVIFSPNVQLVDGRAFTPRRIDPYIQEQKAEALRGALARTGGEAEAPPYESRLHGRIDPTDPVVAGIIDRPLPGGFVGLFDSPIGYIDTDMSGIKPSPLPPSRMYAGRKYRLPSVPAVTDVAVNHIRAAAYVPMQDVSAEMTYDKVQVEPDDIDLVTVEGKFDAAGLYRRFQQSFNGVDVQREEWRDPCLADPVFAAVQLQRQEYQGDGTWSQWREVPRSRVESNQELFQVIERVQDLPPGGLDVRLMQFEEKRITMDLLQPSTYSIASVEEEWFPPSFYDRYKQLQRKAEMEERREEREKERKQDERSSTRQGTRGGGTYGGRTARGRTATGRLGTGRGGVGDDMYGTSGRGGRTGRPGRSSARRGSTDDMMYEGMYGMEGGGPGGRREPTVDDVFFEFRDVLLNYRTDLSDLDEPLLLWAFDDTAEPGKTYRYRLRVGVYNPVAGTGQLVERDLDRSDQVILWGDFSDVTPVVKIPQMMYMFAKGVQDSTKTATVEVARYALGYWRTEDFHVHPGEAIGKEIEPRPDEREEREERRRRAASGRITDSRNDMMMMGMPTMPTPANPADLAVRPEKVDYTTGRVVVDVVEVSDWGSAPNLRPRMYHEMLHTADGMQIEHMPVSMTNWPRDLLDAYQYIQIEKRRKPQPFRSFDKGGIRGRGGMEGTGGYDEMMMYDMGGMPY